MSDSIDLFALGISSLSFIVAGLSFYFNFKNNKKIQDLSQHREQSKLVPKIKGLKIKRKENNPTLAIEIMNVGNYRARKMEFKIEHNNKTLCSIDNKDNNPIEIAPGGYYFFYTTIPWEDMNNDTYNVILKWEDDLTWDESHGKRHSETKVDIFGSYK